MTNLQIGAAVAGLFVLAYFHSKLRRPRIREKWRRELADALADREELVLRVEDAEQCTAFSEQRVILLDDEGLFGPRIKRVSVPYTAITSHGLERASSRADGWILGIGCGEGETINERRIRDEEHAKHADWLLGQALADLRVRA